MDTIETYKEHLGSFFNIEFDEVTIGLELREVNAVTSDTTKSGQAQPFSLIFRSTHEQTFEQGTYQLLHDTLGEKLLFLVPIGPDDVGMCYEAIFT